MRAPSRAQNLRRSRRLRRHASSSGRTRACSLVTHSALRDGEARATRVRAYRVCVDRALTEHRAAFALSATRRPHIAAATMLVAATSMRRNASFALISARHRSRCRRCRSLARSAQLRACARARQRRRRSLRGRRCVNAIFATAAHELPPDFCRAAAARAHRRRGLARSRPNRTLVRARVHQMRRRRSQRCSRARSHIFAAVLW